MLTVLLTMRMPHNATFWHMPPCQVGVEPELPRIQLEYLNFRRVSMEHKHLL